MDRSIDLQRFVDAQAEAYDQALAELKRGRKATHWMWFVVPQIAGLGHSAMARFYAIEALAKYFAGRLDGATLERLGVSAS